MEITLETRNGITPNPTVEFLELCQLAVDYCNNKSLDNCVNLHASVNSMSTPDCYLEVKQRSYYGVICFWITYSVKGTHIRYEFATHEKTGDFSYELAPYVYQTTLGNE